MKRLLFYINQLDRLGPSPKLESPTVDSEGAGVRVLTDPVHARATFVNAQMMPFVNTLTLGQLPMFIGVFFYTWLGLSYTVTMVLCVSSVALVLVAFPRTSAWKFSAEKRFSAVFPEEG